MPDDPQSGSWLTYALDKQDTHTQLPPSGAGDKFDTTRIVRSDGTVVERERVIIG